MSSTDGDHRPLVFLLQFAIGLASASITLLLLFLIVAAGVPLGTAK